jgi:hypothetical protein
MIQDRGEELGLGRCREMSTEEQRDFWRNRLITANKALDQIAEERNTAVARAELAEKRLAESREFRDGLNDELEVALAARDEALARVEDEAAQTALARSSADAAIARAESAEKQRDEAREERDRVAGDWETAWASRNTWKRVANENLAARDEALARAEKRAELLGVAHAEAVKQESRATQAEAALEDLIAWHDEHFVNQPSGVSPDLQVRIDKARAALPPRAIEPNERN